MDKRLFIALVFSLAISACSQERGEGNKAKAEASPAPAASADGAATRPPGPDPELPRELALTAEMLSKQLPLRHQTPQGMVSVSDIEARGTEMIHTVDVPSDLDEGSFEQFKAQLPAHICEDSQLRQLLLRGGSQTYVMRDKDGEEFTATVSRC